MKVFDSIKDKNIDELAEWINEHLQFDFAPWWRHWDENYCGKCEPVVFTDDEGDKTVFAYCEHYGNCRYFNEMDEIPDHKQVIKMWLESESNLNEDCKE